MDFGRIALLLSFLILFQSEMAIGQDGGALERYFRFSEHHPAIPEKAVVMEAFDAPEWKTLWDKARILIQERKYDAAVTAYERLLEKKEDLGEGRWELITLLVNQGKWEKAGEHFDKLPEDYQKRETYSLYMARALMAKNRYARAREALAGLHERNPDDERVIALIGYALLKEGRDAEAVPYLKSLARRHPEDSDLALRLGELHMSLGNHEEALPYLAPLAGQAGASPHILCMAASAHELSGDPQKAAELRERYLAIEDDEGVRRRQAYYLMDKGDYDGSLFHFRQLLNDAPHDDDLRLMIGKSLLALERKAEALPYFEHYAMKHPRDKEVVRTLISLHASGGDEARMLGMLEKYFSMEEEPGSGELKQAARLYQASGRFHEAIPLYKKLLERYPEDVDLLDVLARDLLAIGENEGALSLWRKLVAIMPERLDIQHEMIALMEKLDRRDDLFDALRTLHGLEPDNASITEKLAHAYLERGMFDLALPLYDKLFHGDHATPSILKGKARSAEALEKNQDAYEDYERLLEFVEQEDAAASREIHFHMLRLAGVLGWYEAARKHAESLDTAKAQGKFSMEQEIEIVRALFLSGDFFEASRRCAELIEAAETTEQARVELYLLLARIYEETGMFFEAEEALRLAFFKARARDRIVSLLVELALRGGRSEEAEAWLAGIRESKAGDDEKNGTAGVGDSFFRRDLYRARILFLRGERRGAARAAMELVRNVFLAEARIEEGTRENVNYMLIELAALLGDLGKTDEAVSLARTVAARSAKAPEPFVLLHKIGRQAGNKELEAESRERARDLMKEDPAKLLRLARLYARYEFWEEVVVIASAIVSENKHSVAASILLAQGLERKGNYGEAASLLDEITRDGYRDPFWEIRRIRLVFFGGDLYKGLRLCNNLLASSPGMPQALQLKARILWSMDHWMEARQVYESFLKPRSEILFLEKCLAASLDCAPEVEEPKWWEALPWMRGEKKSPLTEALSPDRMLGAHDGKGEASRIATPLFSLHAWQERFDQELAARRSVMRREYFQAIKQYMALLRHEPDAQPILFDLAGVYSRVEKLGEEAAIYERLRLENDEYPGLADANQRNRLKRKPRASFAVGFQSQEGREGRKDMDRAYGSLSGWYSPSSRHEFSLDLGSHRYRSVEKESDTLWSKRALMTYGTRWSDSFFLTLGGGVEHVNESGGKNVGLLLMEVSNTLGDRLESHFSFHKDLTTDTIHSVSGAVERDTYEIGLAADILPRVQVGVDFSLFDYSDDNFTEGYDIWGAYIFFFEPTYLRLQYAYDYKDSGVGHGPTFLFSGEPSRGDAPYWTPVNYWLNSFSLFFRHTLSEEVLGRGSPTYYTAEFLLSHDSDGHGIQKIGGRVFWEWSDHFLFSGTVSVTSSDIYRDKEISTALTYRW